MLWWKPNSLLPKYKNQLCKITTSAACVSDVNKSVQYHTVCLNMFALTLISPEKHFKQRFSNITYWHFALYYLHIKHCVCSLLPKRTKLGFWDWGIILFVFIILLLRLLLLSYCMQYLLCTKMLVCCWITHKPKVKEAHHFLFVKMVSASKFRCIFMFSHVSLRTC